MLVLTRKLCEQILIPQCPLSVTVCEIQGNTVRLGISAPPQIAMFRKELRREILMEGSDRMDAIPVRKSCRVQEGRSGLRVGGDHRVADARERDRIATLASP
jgi:carbon storage regulator